MSAPTLVLDEVTVAYDRVTALQGVTGAVAAGEAVALIGPNGSGKSTLLRAVLGLVPLSRGRVEVLGRAPAEARGAVAYVPQHEVLDPEFPVTAAQVVLMGRYRRLGWGRRPGRRDRALAAAALEQVHLADRAADRFGTLSGGQRQRVLIARALAQEAELILLDEPFNGVDGTTQELLLDVLGKQLAAGVSVIMSTHDLAVARAACTTACVLSRRQVAFGPVDDALSPEVLREAYGPSAFALDDTFGHPPHHPAGHDHAHGHPPEHPLGPTRRPGPGYRL